MILNQRKKTFFIVKKGELSVPRAKVSFWVIFPSTSPQAPAHPCMPLPPLYAINPRYFTRRGGGEEKASLATQSGGGLVGGEEEPINIGLPSGEAPHPQPTHKTQKGPPVI